MTGQRPERKPKPCSYRLTRASDWFQRLYLAGMKASIQGSFMYTNKSLTECATFEECAADPSTWLLLTISKQWFAVALLCTCFIHTQLQFHVLSHTHIWTDHLYLQSAAIAVTSHWGVQSTDLSTQCSLSPLSPTFTNLSRNTYLIFSPWAKGQQLPWVTPVYFRILGVSDLVTPIR